MVTWPLPSGSVYSSVQRDISYVPNQLKAADSTSGRSSRLRRRLSKMAASFGSSLAARMLTDH